VFLEHAGVAQASVVVVTVADPPVTRHIVEEARRRNPRVDIVARAQSETEWTYLREHHVDDVVLGEREVAAEMARYTLHRFGVVGAELQAVVQGVRQREAETW
jgi:CPA2 family monovalent cation:H+ antiporter-2